MLEMYLIPIAAVTALVLALIRAWATFGFYLMPSFRKVYAFKNQIIREFRLGIIPEFILMFTLAVFLPGIWIANELAGLAISMLISGTLSFQRGRLNLSVT